MKVVLINNSTGLGNYLATKAGIEITGQYTNLHSIKEELYKKMTVADRLLYLCTADTENFTRDLNTIGELLRNYSQLFRFEEIIFYIEKCNATAGYADFVDRVLTEFPDQKYTVPISPLKISFPDAYQVLLGKTDAVLNTEARERIYVKPKGSTVNAIYSRDSRKTTLEPFSYEAIVDYDRLKGDAVKNDSGRLIQDLDGNEIQMNNRFDKPYLGSYEFKPNLGDKNIIIVTGTKASGATTYNNALAISASRGNKNTMIINMTDDAMYANYIMELGAPYGVGCYEYSIKNMLLKKEFEFLDHLCALTMHEVEENLRVDALRYFIKHSYKIDSNYIVIEVPVTLVKEVSRLLRHRLHTIFYVCESVTWELEKAMDMLKTLASSYQTKLWINNETRVRYEEDWLSVGQVMEIIPNDVEIVESMIVESYNIDDRLFAELVGDDINVQ